MNELLLINELGRTLGIDLSFSEANTCGILFDEDEVDFELYDGKLYILAEIGSAQHNEGAYSELLGANYLGTQSGNGSLGLNKNHGTFTLCRVLEGNIEYPDFERILTVFIQTLRYWKDWLKKYSDVPDKVNLPEGISLLSV